MEKEALISIILAVTALLISLAVYVNLHRLSVRSTNQALCKASILKSWKTHSFSPINPFGRFRHPGFYGCKTTFAVINEKGIYEGEDVIVDFSKIRDKDKINEAIMKFLADEMATCWSTFYEGNQKIFDFNSIMKRSFGDTGAICVTCDDIEIDYLPYGRINHSKFINFLNHTYINVSDEDSSGVKEETYYEYLYGSQSEDLKHLQVSLWNILKTNFQSLTNARNFLRSSHSSVSTERIMVTLTSSIFADESSETYQASEPKGYLTKIGKAYNIKNTNKWISCDDKNDLYESSNSGTNMLSSGGAYCNKDNLEVLTCINKTVYRINGTFCSGNSIMNCTSKGPVRVKTCDHGCAYGKCVKIVKGSSKGLNNDIVPGDYNILFYVVGKPIYMDNPVPFILLINVKNLFNSCDWLSLR